MDNIDCNTNHYLLLYSYNYFFNARQPAERIASEGTMEDQAFDFGQIKAAHDALMREYARVLVDEAGRKNRTVQALVESHVREKLLQLEKVYTLLGFHHRSVDAAFSGWLAAQAADCGAIAAKLTTFNQFCARPVKIAGGILVFLASLFLLFVYGKTVSLPEVIYQWQVLAEFITRYYYWFWFIGSGLLGVLFIILSFPMIKAFGIKLRLFGAPDMVNNRSKMPVSDWDIYQFENRLFLFLKRKKQPEFPYDLALISGYFLFAAIFFTTLFLLLTRFGNIPSALIVFVGLLIPCFVFILQVIKRRAYY